jgi:hypothetical protein
MSPLPRPSPAAHGGPRLTRQTGNTPLWPRPQDELALSGGRPPLAGPRLGLRGRLSRGPANLIAGSASALALLELPALTSRLRREFMLPTLVSVSMASEAGFWVDSSANSASARLPISWLCALVTPRRGFSTSSDLAHDKG